MKIRIILPYFGQFNNYFEYWIESCGQNSKIDFLIMTDQEIPKDHPKNITFVYTTLNELTIEGIKSNKVLWIFIFGIFGRF